ncbi:GntR family transcriptional regulator [Gammaproteobacteria bacterium]|nr:GntR family transcriptional regulator [Gammaproteobacteria bacterium]
MVSSRRKHLVLADSIVRLAESECWQPGIRLLPQRQLAARFSTSLQTVNTAIAELETRGLVGRQPGSGCFWKGDERGVPKQNVLDLSKPRSPHDDRLDLRLRALATRVVDTDVYDTLALERRCPGEVPASLRDWLQGLDLAGEGEGDAPITLAASAAQLLTQLLGLIGGEVLCSESVDPTISLAARISNVRLQVVASDNQGPTADAIASAVRTQRVKALLVCPSGGQPSGAMALSDRRQQWADLARRHHFAIIEFDPWWFAALLGGGQYAQAGARGFGLDC